MELDACTRCGECVKWCPTYSEDGHEALQPAEKIRRMKSFITAQYGFRARLFGPKFPTDEALDEYSQGVYDCTLCGRCNAVCPVKIDTRPLWVAMREHLVELGHYSELFDTLREKVATTYNISGDNNEDRLIWSENLEPVPEQLRDLKRGRAEVLLFMGCVSAMYPMAYSILQSFVQTLEQAGVTYTTLAGEEWCCGYPLYGAGLRPEVTELARHNLERARGLEPKYFVATCPSCYHTWAHIYPQYVADDLGFEVLHASELLAQLIEEGRIKLSELDWVVTYHDPCDLGRSSGIYDAPRGVICSIPGISFTEMEENRRYALCCGGGGNLAMWEADLTEDIAERRLEQAKATGATAVISACQQCKRTLLQAARKTRTRIRVLDVTELVWQAMEKGEVIG
jgi:heterodisulfide reductase subunit D